MVDKFQISSSPKLLFGIGTFSQLPEIINSYGKRVLIITGTKTSKYVPGLSLVFEKLNSSGIDAEVVEISHEPHPEDIDSTVRSNKGKHISCVVSIGGGSVIDAGKAISAMLCSPKGVKNYLEGVGDEVPNGDKLPFIAVPTTAGTGSEATKNAVISEHGENGYKKSLRHDNYVPDIALLDPELTRYCPKQITAASGMDAFTQLLESYLSSKANYFTDTLAIRGLMSIYDNLQLAYNNPDNLDARSEVAMAAYLSGITLANAGLGVVHGFAQPFGSIFDVPHGVVCGTLMAAVNDSTARKLLNSGKSNTEALKKYVKIGKMFARTHSKSDNYYVEYCIDELHRLTNELNLPLLSEYGINQTDYKKIINRTELKNHPVKLEDEELIKILKTRI